MFSLASFSFQRALERANTAREVKNSQYKVYTTVPSINFYPGIDLVHDKPLVVVHPLLIVQVGH